MKAAQIDHHPVVAVPARNEVERLPSLLDALARQTWLERSGRQLDVILVLNNCDDGSADITDGARSIYPGLRLEVIEVELPPPLAHVGWARRMAMDRAYACAKHSGVLLSTDADAVPAPNWIDATLDAITAGAELVGGHLIVDEAEEAALGAGFVRRAMRQLEYARLTDQLTSLVLPTAHDPWPRHSDHTGASLAVRSHVYAAAGGIPPMPYREDVRFVEKALARGYRLRHPLDVVVNVSARLDGRARGGMADCLKAWMAAERAGARQLVEAPVSILARLAAAQLKRSHRLSAIAQSAGAARNLAVDYGAGMDIDAAMMQTRQLIADREGAIRVP